MDLNIDSSKKLTLEASTFLIIYRRYKGYLIPISVIFACVVVFFFIVIPEVQQYFTSRNKLKEETQKLEILKNNYNFLSNLDDAKTDSDLKALSLALPPNKDFVGIMNAISSAASKTGVSIGDFEFSLGDLNKVSVGVSSFPSTTIKINIGANAQGITKFVSELYKTVPVAEVTSIKTSINSSALIISFYYKPFPPQNISDETSLIPLSAKDLALIKELSLWNNSTVEPLLPLTPTISVSSSTESAESNPNPF